MSEFENNTPAPEDKKAEIKLDVKPDAKTDIKSEPKLEVKLDVKLDTKSEHKVDDNLKVEGENKSDIKLDVKPEPKSKVEIDVKPGDNPNLPKKKSKKKLVIAICVIASALPVLFLIFIILAVLLFRGCSSMFAPGENSYPENPTEVSRVETILPDNSSDDWYEGPSEDSKTPEHVHSYSSEWISNAAVHWHQCECGERTDTAYHEYSQWVITTEATETTTGMQERSCSYCGYMETEVIPLLQHTHSYSSGWSSNASSHWKVCSCGEKANVSSHTFGSWKTVTAATCTRNGKRVRTCTACYFEESQTVSATSHSYSQGTCVNCGSLQSQGLSIGIETVNGRKIAVVYSIGTCKDSNIYIPAKYNGVPVTTIGHAAFRKCTFITSITIPNSVTTIENDAFTGCTGLTRAVFADTTGWYITTTEGASSGSNLAITDQSKAAEYLKTYRHYYWYKK